MSTLGILFSREYSCLSKNNARKRIEGAYCTEKIVPASCISTSMTVPVVASFV